MFLLNILNNDRNRFAREYLKIRSIILMDLLVEENENDENSEPPQI